MTVHSAFKPHYGSNQAVTPAAASATITCGAGDKTIRVHNAGAANMMFFRTGKASEGAVVASGADMPVAPGQTVFIEKPQDHDTVAHISATGTTANIMSGEGGI